MTCPYCQLDSLTKKRGFYTRPGDAKRIQRYHCARCSKSFSHQTLRIDYRFRKRHLDQPVFRAICKGNSQRGAAFLFACKPETIARRIKRYGRVCEQNLAQLRQELRVKEVMFDELETFEHTNCKPLTVPIAVEARTRRILTVGVGQIAAKGHLAAISRKKYGRRPCARSKVLLKMAEELSECVSPQATIATDESPHYPALVAKYFPKAKHMRTKGRRGATVGQGELKERGFDPLFSLNHTYAMFRDNLKTLSRRTWCTTKKPAMLRWLLFMYAWFHNLRLTADRGILSLYPKSN